MLDEISVLIINYRTLDLTARCLESLQKFYPQVEVTLVDNGSDDESTDFIQEMAGGCDTIHAILNRKNRYHGPALDQGLRLAQTRLVFSLDSDCEVLQGGFLEAMIACFSDPCTYAVGELVRMNRFGYPLPEGEGRGFDYVHPRRMLLDRRKYLGLKRFTHHGAPCLSNMRQAIQRGYRLGDFPIQDYILHLGRGTCSSYGYGFGLRHKLENLLNRALRAISAQ
jgi:glycosyltransferase involved in cell wall biosynthesis